VKTALEIVQDPVVSQKSKVTIDAINAFCGGKYDREAARQANGMRGTTKVLSGKWVIAPCFHFCLIAAHVFQK
jgi:hypothetical protein